MANDELDYKLLEKLKWQSATSADDAARLVEEAQRRSHEASEDEAPAPSSTLREILRARSRALCNELAREIQAAWAQPAKAQASAVVALAERVAEGGFLSFGFCNHPLAATRMMRLLLRCEDAVAEDALNGAFLILPSAVEPHPELVALVCELAESGNRTARFCFRLAKITEEPRFRQVFAEAVPRLARVLDESERTSARVTAAEFLGSARTHQATLALRGALRSRRLAVREAALDALLSYGPPALAEEDVCFLLEDAALHVLPDDGDDAVATYDLLNAYALRLEQATVAVHPPGGVAPLVQLARGEARASTCFNDVLDEEWALVTLAAAYPAQSLPLVDAALRSSRQWTRRYAVAAAERLPWELARPRLLTAACDGARAVAERAREAWRDLQHSPCPTAETDGLCLELLEGPPSDGMLLRLAVLRGDSEEAKRKLLPLLLEEAPSREALVLVLFAIQDDATFCHGAAPLLPTHAADRGKLLVERFGAPAIEGLVWLGLRHPHGYDSGFQHLDAVASRADLPAETRDRLRELAVRAFRELAPDERDGALSLLAQLGAPPDLFPALLELVVGEARHDWKASTALMKSPNAEQPVVASLQKAVEARDWRLIPILGCLAARARWESARGLLLCLVRETPAGEDAAAVAIEEIGASLWDAGWLAEAEVWEWLDDPGRPRFLVAADNLRPTEPEAAARVHAALAAALDSPALAGRSAGASAAALLYEERIEPDSPALLRALRAAPLDVRGEILAAPAFHTEWIDRSAVLANPKLRRISRAEGRRPRHRMTEEVRAEVLRAFADPAVDHEKTWMLVDVLTGTSEGRDLLLRARAGCPSIEVRDEIADVCRVPREDADYWEKSFET
ncbi:MAG: hypothetical protein ACOX6T_21985 [Myxococcales bacterium]|jgi:hypothetical protein